MKDGIRLGFVPTRREAIRSQLSCMVDRYNQYRPHSALEGKTPNEVYYRRFPANRRPRWGPRPDWPRGSPYARPQVLVAGKPGARIGVEVERVGGHAHLPIIRLRRAA